MQRLVFCPKCGKNLENNIICPHCGYNCENLTFYDTESKENEEATPIPTTPVKKEKRKIHLKRKEKKQKANKKKGTALTEKRKKNKKTLTIFVNLRDKLREKTETLQISSLVNDEKKVKDIFLPLSLIFIALSWIFLLTGIISTIPTIFTRIGQLQAKWGGTWNGTTIVPLSFSRKTYLIINLIWAILASIIGVYVFINITRGLIRLYHNNEDIYILTKIQKHLQIREITFYALLLFLFSIRYELAAVSLTISALFSGIILRQSEEISINSQDNWQKMTPVIKTTFLSGTLLLALSILPSTIRFLFTVSNNFTSVFPVVSIFWMLQGIVYIVALILILHYYIFPKIIPKIIKDELKILEQSHFVVFKIKIPWIILFLIISNLYSQWTAFLGDILATWGNFLIFTSIFLYYLYTPEKITWKAISKKDENKEKEEDTSEQEEKEKENKPDLDEIKEEDEIKTIEKTPIPEAKERKEEKKEERSEERKQVKEEEESIENVEEKPSPTPQMDNEIVTNETRDLSPEEDREEDIGEDIDDETQTFEHSDSETKEHTEIKEAADRVNDIKQEENKEHIILERSLNNSDKNPNEQQEIESDQTPSSDSENEEIQQEKDNEEDEFKGEKETEDQEEETIEKIDISLEDQILSIMKAYTVFPTKADLISTIQKELSLSADKKEEIEKAITNLKEKKKIIYSRSTPRGWSISNKERGEEE